MVFTFFCFLVDEKIKLKVLPCSFVITYRTSFENPSRNPLQKAYSGDFGTVNAYRKPPVILYNHTGRRL
jgi:hypothetical protein